MIIYNSTESYTRPTANVGIRQQLARRGVWDIPGGALLWRAIGRVGLAVVVATCGVQLLLGVVGNHLTDKMARYEEQRHQLMDTNITLRATRAGMLTQQAVEAAAGKALSLYSPVEGQRFVFNRNTGRFDKL